MAELNNPNDTINQKSRKDIDEEFDKEYCSFITNDGNLTTDKEIMVSIDEKI